MQKLLITTSSFTGYSTIFDVTGDTIVLHAFEDGEADNFTPLSLASLPFDIKYEIFDCVILSMMKERLLKKALSTLLTSSFQICKYFYTKYIGNYNLDRTQIIDHLISLFNFFNDITTVMFFEDSGATDELVLSIYCRNFNIDIENKRWPFGELTQSTMDIRPRICIPELENYTMIRTGPSYSDFVWVSGKEENGVVHADLLKGPILILEIYTQKHGIEHTIVETKTNFFKNMIRLLKVSLGEKSGVYLVFPLEGFFGLVHEV